MFSRILKYLESNELHYTLSDEYKDKRAYLSVSTETGKFNCILDVDNDIGRMLFFSIFPINVSNEIRTDVLIVLNAINYDLFQGNFEINFETGEIRFRTSLLYLESEISDIIIDNIIRPNVITMHTYYDLLYSISARKISVDEAVEVAFDLMHRDHSH